MGYEITGELSESQIVKLWLNLLWNRNELTTDEGNPITVLYPGRANDGQGADFRDAVIATSHGVDTGDIEIHVHSSDWRHHQHHLNPFYNRVILHVVMKQDNRVATQLQNGKTIPTIVLNNYIAHGNNHRQSRAPSHPAAHLPCLNNQVISDAEIIGFMDSSGNKRFQDKVSRFERNITRQGPGQSLYQGIMEALGYSRNKLPFRELAHRLPIHVLESESNHLTAGNDYLRRLQALLLGTAGLSGLKHHNPHREDLTDATETPYTHSAAEPMSPDAWEVFRVRPANHPERRIMAMSHLLLRYQQKGILPELVHMVEKAHRNGGHHLLEAGLIVQGNKRPGKYSNSRPHIRLNGLPLLGRNRAADIVVNVILPFTCAWGNLNSQQTLIRKSRDLYREYTRLAVNAVERHMITQFRLKRNLVNTARRQQGLIHIYNTLCTRGKCNDCPLGKSV